MEKEYIKTTEEHIRPSTIIEWVQNRLDEAKGVAMFRNKNAKQIYTYWEDELKNDCMRIINLIQQSKTLLDLVKKHFKDNIL